MPLSPSLRMGLYYCIDLFMYCAAALIQMKGIFHVTDFKEIFISAIFRSVNKVDMLFMHIYFITYTLGTFTGPPDLEESCIRYIHSLCNSIYLFCSHRLVIAISLNMKDKSTSLSIRFILIPNAIIYLVWNKGFFYRNSTFEVGQNAEMIL